MFARLLIANRGEIARRIIRTARSMGIRTIAVFSDADRDALHAQEADEALRIGPAPAAQSYLDGDAILAAAKQSGADAIHPGYGFLSENPDFAAAVEQAGLIFVGPPPAAMRLLGLKGEAKRLMRKAGIPVVPGYEGDDQSAETLAREAAAIGYPVLLKAVAGGGGRGMRLVTSPEEFPRQLAAARREAASGFGDDRLLIEKHLAAVRHVEVQVMADRHGNVIHLFERDCSAQRRHQKVVEEAPAPGLAEEMRQAMCAAAVAAARQAGYAGAGTVEFLVQGGAFHFIEMNTRLQVEHPVTEMISGLDLVALQLRAAAGEALGMSQQDVQPRGHAIEARIYAEDPAQGFRPQTGRITALHMPEGEGLRFDGGVRAGDEVTSFYDPMIGKLIVHAPTRVAAVSRLGAALARAHVGGLVTNLAFLTRLAHLPAFETGGFDTGLLDRSLDELTRPMPPPLPVIAAAVLAFEGRLDEQAASSPFHTLRGFQLWGGDARPLRLRCDGETIDATFFEEQGAFTLSRDGQSLRFTLLRRSLPDLWLSTEEGNIHLRCHQESDGFILLHGHERYRLAREISSGRDPGEGGNRVIASPVPGLLARLMVTSGEIVKPGDMVAVVEAMKTEFILVAEAGGAVTLHAEQGAQLAQGDVIAEIGASDG